MQQASGPRLESRRARLARFRHKWCAHGRWCWHAAERQQPANVPDQHVWQTQLGEE